MHRTIRLGLLLLLAVVTLMQGCRRRQDPIQDLHDKGELRNIALSLSVIDMPEQQASQSRSSRGMGKSGDGAFSYSALIEQFRSTRAGSVPGSAHENAVYNLNIFLVHTALGDRDVRFFYFDQLSNPTTAVPDPNKFPLILKNLFNGQYRIYAIANNGSALYTPSAGEVSENFHRCSLTEAQIKELRTSGSGSNPSNGGLLMSTTIPCDPVDLGRPSSEPFSYTMNLERRVAKVSIRYDVLSTLEFEAKYINLNNIPSKIYPFSPDKEPTTTNRLIASPPLIPMEYYSTYVLENKRGNIVEIISEDMRSSRLAPAKASYIFLDGLSDPNDISTAIGYQIYLGDGRIANFDLDGNKQYNFTTFVEGDSQDDSRVSSFTIKDEALSNIAGGKSLTIYVSYSNQYNNSFKLERTKMAGGELTNLKVHIKNADGSKTEVTDDGVAICDPSQSTEKNVKIDIEITYDGYGSLQIAVTDKYFRTRSIINQI